MLCILSLLVTGALPLLKKENKTEIVIFFFFFFATNQIKHLNEDLMHFQILKLLPPDGDNC